MFNLLPTFIGELSLSSKMFSTVSISILERIGSVCVCVASKRKLAQNSRRISSATEMSLHSL